MEGEEGEEGEEGKGASRKESKRLMACSACYLPWFAGLFKIGEKQVCLFGRQGFSRRGVEENYSNL